MKPRRPLIRSNTETTMLSAIDCGITNPSDKTVFGDIGNALPDRVPVMAQRSNLAVDQDLAGIWRIHSKQRKEPVRSGPNQDDL